MLLIYLTFERRYCVKMAALRRNRTKIGWTSKRRFSLQITVVIICILIIVVLLYHLQQLMFGYGPTHRGGRIGRYIDNTIRIIAFEYATIRHKVEFTQYMGYTVPPLIEHGANQVGVHVLLNAWLAQILMRTKYRRNLIQNYTNTSDTTIPNNRVDPNGRCIPRLIIQPNVGDWYRPMDFPNETSSQIGRAHV